MENNKKKIEKILKGSEDCFLLVSKNGSATVGYGHEILTMLTMLIRDVKKCNGIKEEDVDRAFELSKMSDEELAKKALEKMKELIEKMGNKNEK